jgi:transposase
LRRLIDHLCAHRGEWLVFLHEAGVPPTNNHAEQMLRPTVMSRKLGGCNQSDQGAAVHSILTSILGTVKRVGQTIVVWAVPWLRQGQMPALPW